MDGPFAVVLAIVAIVFFVLFSIVLYSGHQRGLWLEAHCTIIGQMSGDVGVGISGSGNVVTTVSSGKTGYKCDNNMTYWE